MAATHTGQRGASSSDSPTKRRSTNGSGLTRSAGSFVAAGLDAGMSELAMQIAGRWADSRMVRVYDQRHHSLDKHAAYAIATFIAGAA